MTPDERRQQVREALAEHLYLRYYNSVASQSLDWSKEQDGFKVFWRARADLELAFLDSLGMRLKVEGELPANMFDDNQYGISQQDMLAAGYTKTVRLV